MDFECILLLKVPTVIIMYWKYNNLWYFVFFYFKGIGEVNRDYGIN